MSKSAPEPQNPAPDWTRWAELTPTDLHGWAGERTVSRGRSYQRLGKVRELSASREGELVAWVAGGSQYATRVRIRGSAGGSGGPVSTCSCPVGHDCKHAVAVVVELLHVLDEGRDVPCSDPDDLRWGLAQVEFPFRGTTDEETLQSQRVSSRTGCETRLHSLRAVRRSAQKRDPQLLVERLAR